MTMFGNLCTSLNKVFGKLRGSRLLTEAEIKCAMRDIRIALLEADVALTVVKELIERITEQAIGVEVLKNVQPGQMVVKIVHDELIRLMHSEKQDLNLARPIPVVIMLVGLQGVGKTTTAAKVALYLKKKCNKKPLMASLDTRRPAAQKQLEVLGKQIDVATVPIIEGQQVLDIAEHSVSTAYLGGFDVLVLDTAGRLHVDKELMSELGIIAEKTSPAEMLLVVDAMIGQESTKVAQAFQEQIPLTGIILTKADSDARGGAVLSIRYITNCPVKFLGTGEKINELEEFHADRVVSRILGMGDIVSLVEKASEAVSASEMQKLSQKMHKGSLDFDDLLVQLKTMRKMGGVNTLISMLPGISQLGQHRLDSISGEAILLRQEAIIKSMTKIERKTPKILNASRKHRIANGSGTSLQEINKLLKQYLEIQNMMKKFANTSPKGLQRAIRLLSSGGR